MSKLDGVTGDSRKRIEAAALAEASVLAFDRHPECLLCGRRDYHSHVGLEGQVRELFSGTRD